MGEKKVEIKSLYYITHVANLPSILRNGILSHKLIEEGAVDYTRIYDASIVNRRKDTVVPGGKSLWEYANLYFQPRNPMLYRVLHEQKETNIAILGVHRDVLDIASTLLSLGNAACGESEILLKEEGLKGIAEIWDSITAEWWNSVDGSKRRIMAECLVPGSIPPDLIHTVFVAGHKVAQEVKKLSLPRDLPVVPEPNMFFRPAKAVRVTARLSLVEGDMFFSSMQTLTVSVNTVGIMGKGLASRAKYQFPDVYVVYQDVCRRKALGFGKPYLYKREAFVDEELADEPSSLLGANAKKWFLLFATKRHWRDGSDINGIAEGLRWISDNYKREGIQSLAMPALGCGLGQLEWQDVGPVMCRELSGVEVPVAIYLPREREIPQEHVSEHFLFGR